MSYRPDELASISQIERDKNVRKNVKKGVKESAKIAATVGLGFGYGKLAQKLAPFLNEMIPLDIAIKGINKISPKIGKFLKTGQNMGLDLEEGIDFIKEKLTPQKSKKAKSVFQEIVGDIDISSLNPNIQNQLGFLESISNQLESQGKGLQDPSFRRLAKKIKDVLAGKSGLMMEEIGRPEMGSQPQQPEPTQQVQQSEAQPQQPGPGQQALMAILQKIQATRGQQ